MPLFRLLVTPFCFVAAVFFGAAIANLAHAAGPFDEPARACAALSAEGLAAETGWAPSLAVADAHGCASPTVAIGAPGPNGRPTRIAYIVVGAKDAVDEIRILLTLDNAGTRPIALRRLRKAVAALFAAYGRPAPEAVLRSIAVGRPSSASTALGPVELTRQEGPIERMEFTLSSARPSARARAARRSFDGCRTAVSRISGHPIATLAGDGLPVKAGGHRTFLMAGPKRARFSCEVRPGGRYRILAALRGHFPMHPIDRGMLPH